MGTGLGNVKIFGENSVAEALTNLDSGWLLGLLAAALLPLLLLADALVSLAGPRLLLLLQVLTRPLLLLAGLLLLLWLLDGPL